MAWVKWLLECLLAQRVMSLQILEIPFYTFCELMSHGQIYFAHDHDDSLFYGTTACLDCVNLTFITPNSWNYEFGEILDNF